jgi:hypothetical protein
MLNNNEAPNGGGKVFIRKPHNDLPVNGRLTCFTYLSPFSSYSHKIDLIATEMPRSGENIFIRRPDNQWSVDRFCLNLTVFELLA